MKKILALLYAVLIIGTALCACSSDSGAKADKSLDEIYAEIKSEVTLPDMVELDSVDRLDRNYGITKDMVDEFAGGIDSSGVTMSEIVLIKAKDADSADKIAEKLNTRLSAKLDQNRNYNPEQAAVIEKCKVETKDLYVTMIISEDAEKITEIFNKHFK